MRFSEAMLLGLPEIKFDLYQWYDPKECAGCLVGAALRAEGCKTLIVPDDSGMTLINARFSDFWPWMKTWTCPAGTECPQCKIDLGATERSAGGISHFWSVCTHLSLHYKEGAMTAEAIADFLSTIEPPEQSVESQLPNLTREMVLATVQS